MRVVIRSVLWVVAAAVLAVVGLQLWYFAHIWWWRDHAPRETVFMAQRLHELRERNPQAQLQYIWVPYHRISVNLKRAMIAARRYFGESAAQLSGEQAARLAAMAPNPRHYEKNPGSRGLAQKIPIIQARMPSAELP